MRCTRSHRHDEALLPGMTVSSLQEITFGSGLQNIADHGGRLPILCRHQMAVVADHVRFSAPTADMLVALSDNRLDPDRFLRTRVGSFDHRQGPRQSQEYGGGDLVVTARPASLSDIFAP